MSVGSFGATESSYVAVHRFGLGDHSLNVAGSSPQAWVLGQIGPADTAIGDGLLTTAQGLELIHNEDSAAADADKLARGTRAGATAADQVLTLQKPRDDAMLADKRSRLLTAVQSKRPFNERLVMFWTNHFTVSSARGAVRGLTGAFERDAIRPHIAARFEDMLFAATTHPGMLRYLDNITSAGPESPIVRGSAPVQQGDGDRPRGLNENLAREVLELHVLGVGGATSGDQGRSPYTQKDVTAFANLLTGWRVAPSARTVALDPAWHQPGPKTVMGKVYPEGAGGLRAALRDLAAHPVAAHYLSSKLARYFVSDDPPASLIARMESAYRQSGGELATVYRAMIESPQAWAPASRKLKTPEDLVVSTARVIGLANDADEKLAHALVRQSTELGQPTQTVRSPQGWVDRPGEWLGSDQMWKRMEWASRIGVQYGDAIDARAVAQTSLGPRLSTTTRLALKQASDGRQALALFLMSPEFQRR